MYACVRFLSGHRSLLPLDQLQFVGLSPVLGKGCVCVCVLLPLASTALTNEKGSRIARYVYVCMYVRFSAPTLDRATQVAGGAVPGGDEGEQGHAAEADGRHPLRLQDPRSQVRVRQRSIVAAAGSTVPLTEHHRLRRSYFPRDSFLVSSTG